MIPVLSLLIDIEQFHFQAIYKFRMSSNLAVDVIDCFEEHVELVSVDVRSEMGFCFLPLLLCLLSETLSSLLSLFLLLLDDALIIHSLFLLFLDKVLDQLLDVRSASTCLDLQPVEHDCILEYNGKVSAVILSLVVIHHVL
jgi:hypothetical protein